MDPTEPRIQRITFDRFEVDLCSGEVRKNGRTVPLQAQPFQLLTLLLEHPGEVVMREEVRRKLWPADTFVDFDHSLGTAINKIREALNDSPEKPRFIETLPRRGYRFIGEIAPQAQPAVPAEPSHRKHTRPRWIAIAAGLLAILGSTLAVGFAYRWSRPQQASGWWFFSRKTHPLTEKDTIVLADFMNTTGDTVFDGTLRQGLSVQLEQSPFLRILSDQQIQQTLPMMGQKPDAKLTPGIARELCQRTASAAVLDGSIAQIGTQYLLILKAVNCSNGNFMASTEAQASDKNHVLEALGKAASEIRNKLGESVASIQKFDAPLEQVTTSSLEALKAYSLVQRGGVPPNDSLLPHAIELDPNFALAYSFLADNYGDFGEAELSSEYAQKAFALRERVTERERLHITATYYFATLGDLDQELRTYPIWEQMYPRDWEPWNNSSGSRQLLGDYARALQEAQEALRLNPNQSNPYLNVGLGFLSLDRREEAKQIVQQAQARNLDVPELHVLVYLLAFLENDTRKMEAQLVPWSSMPVEAAALSPVSVAALSPVSAQSSTEAYFGRLRNSLGLSRRAVEIARRRNFNELAALVQDTDALREAEFGNPGQARQAAVTALTLSSGRRAKLFTSLALARAGDVTRAQALADELNRQFRSDTLLQKYWLPTIRGSIELARKNPSKALDALQSVSYELGDVGFPAGNLYPVYVRGQAYLGTRQGKEAAAEFQKFLEHRSIVLNSPLGALAYLGLARAHSLQGDTEKARGAYQDFLALWKDADPDLPILKQAKAEYGKLQ